MSHATAALDSAANADDAPINVGSAPQTHAATPLRHMNPHAIDPPFPVASLSSPPPSLRTRYVASVLLAATGDAMGYRAGQWEFNHSGVRIHEEVQHITGGAGPKALRIKKPEYPLSDDTVMLLATGEGFLAPDVLELESACPSEQQRAHPQGLVFDQRCASIAAAYVASFDDMAGRAPGVTTGASIQHLREVGRERWHTVPFNPRGGGCGGAMRSMVLGLLLPRPEQQPLLLHYSIECGRMTHNHPTGWLGSVASACMVAWALQDVPLVEWGRRLLDLLPSARAYIEYCGRDVAQQLKAMNYFEEAWTAYLRVRGIEDGSGDHLRLPDPATFGPKQRDDFYASLAFRGGGVPWAGSSGHDAPMIAYDALLQSGDSWEQFCHTGILHGGDNDSTGVIGGACFGAMYGFHGVPVRHHAQLEYHDRLQRLADACVEYAVDGGDQVGLQAAERGEEGEQQLQHQQQQEEATGLLEHHAHAAAGAEDDDADATQTAAAHMPAIGPSPDAPSAVAPMPDSALNVSASGREEDEAMADHLG